MGVPFFKYAALNTGGEFSIDSTLGVGTTTTAVFVLTNIDRMPLGDMTSTMHTLITMHADTDFLYNYILDERSFILDTREFRNILGDVSFNTPEVSSYIKEFLIENKNEVDNGMIL